MKGMTRMTLRKRLGALLLTASLLTLGMFATASPVAAALTCPDTENVISGGSPATTVLVLYEGTGYTVTSPDHRALCVRINLNVHGTYGFDLSTINYSCDACTGTKADWCASQGIGSSGWNDCVSAYRFNAGCHWHWSLYQDAGYGGHLIASDSNAASNSAISAPWGDQASSLKITYSSVCISAPSQ